MRIAGTCPRPVSRKRFVWHIKEAHRHEILRNLCVSFFFLIHKYIPPRCVSFSSIWNINGGSSIITVSRIEWDIHWLCTKRLKQASKASHQRDLFSRKCFRMWFFLLDEFLIIIFSTISETWELIIINYGNLMHNATLRNYSCLDNVETEK